MIVCVQHQQRWTPVVDQDMRLIGFSSLRPDEGAPYGSFSVEIGEDLKDSRQVLCAHIRMRALFVASKREGRLVEKACIWQLENDNDQKFLGKVSKAFFLFTAEALQ